MYLECRNLYFDARLESRYLATTTSNCCTETFDQLSQLSSGDWYMLDSLKSWSPKYSFHLMVARSFIFCFLMGYNKDLHLPNLHILLLLRLFQSFLHSYHNPRTWEMEWGVAVVAVRS